MNKCDLDAIFSCAPAAPPGFRGPTFRHDESGAHADYVGRLRRRDGEAFVGRMGEAFGAAREALGGPFYWEAGARHLVLPGGETLLTWSMRQTTFLRLPPG